MRKTMPPEKILMPRPARGESEIRGRGANRERSCIGGVEHTLSKWSWVFKRIWETMTVVTALVALSIIVGAPIFTLVQLVRGTYGAWDVLFVFIFSLAALVVSSACLLFGVTPVILLLVFLVLWIRDGGLCVCMRSACNAERNCMCPAPPANIETGEAVALSVCCIFWNTITWILAGPMIRDFIETGEVVWFLVCFMTPFVVIGLGLLIVALPALYVLLWRCCNKCRCANAPRHSKLATSEISGNIVAQEVEMIGDNATLSTEDDCSLSALGDALEVEDALEVV